MVRCLCGACVTVSLVLLLDGCGDNVYFTPVAPDAGPTCTLMTWYFDGDGDGYGLATDSVQACTPPANYTGNGLDCNDLAADVHPGATEVPGDLIDEDCDNVELCYSDADADGYRSDTPAQSFNLTCSETGQAVATVPGGDCDDTNAQIHPGEAEIVGDGVDRNCDGSVMCFSDADADGYRGNSVVVSGNSACNGIGEAPLTRPDGDCDDHNALIHPGQTEICDGVDNDCDDLIDEAADVDLEGCAAVAHAEATSCADGGCVYACDANYMDSNSDLVLGPAGDGCNCHPTNGGVEACDGIDNNCDGTADENLGVRLDLCPAVPHANPINCSGGACVYVCVQPYMDANENLTNGASGDGCECAPSNGGVEACDGMDNDCNNIIDDSCVSSNHPPVAQITLPNPAQAEVTLNFSGISSYDQDAGDSITRHSWTFGDTFTGTGVLTSHIYSLPGQYLVRLDIEDNHGATAFAQNVLTVIYPPSKTYNVSPSVSYSCSYFGTPMVSVNFSQLRFTTSGSMLTVTSIPAGGQPGNMTQIPAPFVAAFDASKTLTGGCDETYRITGNFDSNFQYWTGQFTMSFVGDQCSLTDCLDQSFFLTGTRQ